MGGLLSSFCRDAQGRHEVSLSWSGVPLGSPDPAESHRRHPGSQGQATGGADPWRREHATQSTPRGRAPAARGSTPAGAGPCPPPSPPGREWKPDPALSFSFPGRIAITGAPRAPARPGTCAHPTRRSSKEVRSRGTFQSCGPS